MTKSRIVLSEELIQPLPVQSPPVEDALRWRSEHERGQVWHDWPEIFITQDAYREINAHARSDMGREVGGMLVGEARRTPDDTLYVVIEGQLPARHVAHGPAHLTFTSDTLTDALDRLEERFPDKQVVGWYHTHPGLSVFLSSMDVWLHTHFFPKAWHVALVIDPIANQAGFFRYANGQRVYLHPEQYVGFYELAGPGAESVVGWRNLLPGAGKENGARG
jgi:proteasome lid subunit RPN8/RPN11